MKILTFDIEDWFHLLDHESTASVESWHGYPSRVREGVDRLLDLLRERDTRATFFCLGWVAERYPDVIRAIDEAGFHIGTHSYAHQLAYQQSATDFREDLRRSIGILEEITGKRIDCYRAPGFSITAENLWVFEILIDEGIRVDCSLFAAERAHGGVPQLRVERPAVGDWNGTEIKVFPMNTRSILGKRLVYSGGGYFRLFPGFLLDKWLTQDDYVMTYFHPRDFDPDQPVLPDLGAVRRFKSYVGLGGARKKLDRILRNHQFIDLPEAMQQIDWSAAPRTNLKAAAS